MIMSSQDVELSARLLDVTNAAELDEFVTHLVAEVGRRQGHLPSPRDARELVAGLTTTALRTVPTLSVVSWACVVRMARPRVSRRDMCGASVRFGAGRTQR